MKSFALVIFETPVFLSVVLAFDSFLLTVVALTVRLIAKIDNNIDKHRTTDKICFFIISYLSVFYICKEITTYFLTLIYDYIVSKTKMFYYYHF